MTPYDTWILSPPDDDRSEVGTEHGQPCLRYDEPDDDAPRGYKPAQCDGVMDLDERDGMICCDTCGEIA